MNPEGTVYNAMGRINRLSVLCIDAYGVAVKNGFEGTVEEWLESLKGEPGADGVGISVVNTYSIPGDPNTTVVRIVLTNDEVTTFNIVHGKKGAKGDKGDPGTASIVDRTTGKTYELYMDNGKMYMEEVAE